MQRLLRHWAPLKANGVLMHDPFIQEAERHGWSLPLRADERPVAARDAVRNYADGEMCDRCDDLIKAFDDEMMRAFFAGTGPFG